MEYTLDTSLARETWAKLDAFTQGYITAAMWTLTDTWFECDHCGNSFRDASEAPETCGVCGSIDTVHEHTDSADHLGLHDIADETIQQAIAVCADFQAYVPALLKLAGDDDERHGADFWLTRNRHGAGFWDRGYNERVGQSLTDAAHSFGSCDWYIGDDGMVYSS